MRPSAARPTSFWRGESGPFVGLSDAPISTAISAQGFLTRSRMRFGLVTTLARRGDGVIGSFYSATLEICCCGQAFALQSEI